MNASALIRQLAKVICSCLLLLSSLEQPGVRGHGRLIDPPSRATMWRFGFNTMANYDDNQGYCGGREQLWSRFVGRCGVCGDPWEPRPRAHERGGRYYDGTPTRSYQEGDVITVVMGITANHKGWVEVRLCPYDWPDSDDVEYDDDGDFVEVSQKCLDKHLLEMADGSGTRYELPEPYNVGEYSIDVRLPSSVSCRKCLLQWKWNVANSWGTDPDGTSCIGCGPQEQFYACADIVIEPANGNPPNYPRYDPEPPTPVPTTPKPRPRPRPKPRPKPKTKSRPTTKPKARLPPPPRPPPRAPQPWSPSERPVNPHYPAPPDYPARPVNPVPREWDIPHTERWDYPALFPREDASREPKEGRRDEIPVNKQFPTARPDIPTPTTTTTTTSTTTISITSTTRPRARTATAKFPTVELSKQPTPTIKQTPTTKQPVSTHIQPASTTTQPAPSTPNVVPLESSSISTQKTTSTVETTNDKSLQENTKNSFWNWLRMNQPAKQANKSPLLVSRQTELLQKQEKSWWDKLASLSDLAQPWGKIHEANKTSPREKRASTTVVPQTTIKTTRQSIRKRTSTPVRLTNTTIPPVDKTSTLESNEASHKSPLMLSVRDQGPLFFFHTWVDSDNSSVTKLSNIILNPEDNITIVAYSGLAGLDPLLRTARNSSNVTLDPPEVDDDVLQSAERKSLPNVEAEPTKESNQTGMATMQEETNMKNSTPKVVEPGDESVTTVKEQAGSENISISDHQLQRQDDAVHTQRWKLNAPSYQKDTLSNDWSYVDRNGLYGSTQADDHPDFRHESSVYDQNTICLPVGNYIYYPQMWVWCDFHCKGGYCPPSYCNCMIYLP